jgi:addiction module HigA family antidote
MTDMHFRPDYAPHPGELLAEYLYARGFSARELARRCGRSPKLITEILTGKAALEPETAIQFERVLDVEATIWLNLEAEYRLLLARQEEQARLAEAIAWAKSFPLSDIYKQNILPKPKSDSDAVRDLTKFFGVASVDACRAAFASLGVSYRHSPSFASDRHSLFVWLRVGELEAEKIDCNNFDRSAFLEELRAIRRLTGTSIDEFLPAIRTACANAGVAFVITPPLGRLAVSGVSRWLSPRKAMIQQSLRHMSNDHFWFTFFHEAAHLLFHSRKTVFVDGGSRGGSNADEENEANRWATAFLIPPQAMATFMSSAEFSEQNVRRFAREVDVTPGIVVGQLQQFQAISYSQLNQLKERYRWTTSR